MFGLKFPGKRAKDQTTEAAAAPCPTRPCATCGIPMPIVSFDQRCPRCRSLMKGSNFCPSACGGCELGKKK